MNLAVEDIFENIFNAKPQFIAIAPGRLEILGNHTDYNEGYVLSAAVDSYTSIALKLSKEDCCRIVSPQIQKEVRDFSLKDIQNPLPAGDWTNYIRGVICEFQKRGFELSPFDAAISSTVPLSAGMSSSAALEMALVSGLCELFNIELNLTEKAKIGQGCENNYIGANTGLMDQFSSLAGKKGQLVLSEYRNHTVNTIPIPEGYSLAVFNSGVKHDLSQEYNERREQCEKAVALLKEAYPHISSLRDVSFEDLMAEKDRLPEVVYRRALHVVGENSRVLQAVALLRENDIESFGKLLFESQQSSIDNFENSCTELDFLYRLAKKSDLCLGARLSGGGFGGISIHLLKSTDIDTYVDYIHSQFNEEYSRIPETYFCTCADGATAKRC